MLRYMELLNDVQRGLVESMIEKVEMANFRGCLMYLPMGSGKTRVSLISGLNMYGLEEGRGPMLVVCSKTLLGNWIDEIHKLFGNSLQYEVLHRDYLGSRLDRWVPHVHTRLILTTPEIVMKSYKLNGLEGLYVIEEGQGFGRSHRYRLPVRNPLMRSVGVLSGVSVIHSMRWDGLYIDECQNYTNIRTQTCRALSSIYRRHSWLLSGTPLQEPKSERLLGFFQLLNYPSPSTLGELNGWLGSGDYPGVRAFAIECSAPKIDSKLECEHHVYDMSESEGVIFLWFRQIIVNWFEYYRYMRTMLPKGSEDLKKIRGHLLSLLTYTRIGIVAPKKAVEMLMEKIERERFLSGLSEVLEELRPHIRDAEDNSSRLDKLDEILASHGNDSCIVFSNFVQTLDHARNYVMERHDGSLGSRRFYILDSSLSSVKRSEVLRQFREDRNGVLFMTYNMGSEGLNLQSANVVINLEPAWNVGKEQQAVGRAYRIGQTKDVYHHYLVSNTQFELSLLLKQVGKTRLLEQLMDGGDGYVSTTQTLGSLSYMEMAELIEKEPIDKLMMSGERYKSKPEDESVVTDMTPTRLHDSEVRVATVFNVPDAEDHGQGRACGD